MSNKQQTLTLTNKGSYWQGCFQAMASPCELLIEVAERNEAEALVKLIYQEAKRVEEKFSRYRDGNIVHQINTAGGQPVHVDAETALLLDYADTCFKLSEGKFDITSGVLRKIWHFDQRSTPPKKNVIRNLLPSIGWQKVNWQKPTLTLPAEMEIDLGGLGKEYAVDRSALLLTEKTTASFLINYGGDIRVSSLRRDGTAWQVAIEGEQQQTISIKQGGIATSGDTHRYLMHKGKRYGHILNPISGWPVKNTPHTITVIADSCMDAGMLSTFAMLEEKHALRFLDEQQVEYYYT